MRHWHVLTCLISLALIGSSEAGPFRKGKPDPEIHVPALINVLKTDKDERRRADAADELGEHDGKAFPAIVPTLVEALTNDPSSSVRTEAAESLGNVRPISSKAGYALEQAINNDKSFTVRVAARTSLLQYRFMGYTGAKPDATVAQTAEPPLASLTADSFKPTPSSTLIHPAPTTPTIPPSSNMPLPLPQTGTREPSNNSSMFPFLNRFNPFNRSAPSPTNPAATVVVKDKSQTGEPPIARPTAPAPRKDFQLMDEPPVSPKKFVPPTGPIPSLPRPMAVLTSDPKPVLTSDPKPEAEARPVLVIPAPPAPPVLQTIPNVPVLKPVPAPAIPAPPAAPNADDGPALPAPK
ncbi:HEAT repeat domain-containing protein [Zavarzinella formosa]|uniref:HEAT repeat domain-containing protein n=1 Tax=Zavarzinella formosa TaxID=360055 RepID=UPI0002FA9DA8|nr:HEAT repeat domain-containing protein [Zavarzinella formosa]